MCMYSKSKHERPIWWDWATFSEDGFLDGIAEDTPDDMKKAYQADMKEREQQTNQGIK